MELSDAEQHALIARCLAGDTTACDVLYASVEQGLYGYIRAVLT